jgi:translation initiation factor 2B subunit (eIF-2B alpha/beta/delta family)
MGSSKMSQEMDADRQFLEDSEKAMQQSMQSEASKARDYELDIKALNEQLTKLRPNARSLKLQDVKVECRQGDCMFEARM